MPRRLQLPPKNDAPWHGNAEIDDTIDRWSLNYTLRDTGRRDVKTASLTGQHSRANDAPVLAI